MCALCCRFGRGLLLGQLAVVMPTVIINYYSVDHVNAIRSLNSGFNRTEISVYQYALGAGVQHIALHGTFSRESK